jgi:hypothetical protein
MNVSYHIGISLAGAALLYYFQDNLSAPCACLISGILPDIDHIWDCREHLGSGASFQEMKKACENSSLKRIRLYFHAFEWWAVITLITVLTWQNYFMQGFLAGYSLHMATDTVFNCVRVQGYSIIYRWITGFKSEFFYDLKRKNR